MALNITSIKPYVPSKNFELSKRFYTALGFTMTEGWGGTADFAFGSQAFRLQDFYVKDWANNFMFVVDVPDVDAWHERARDMLDSNEYPCMRVGPVEMMDGAKVLHVHDPIGVLWIFVH